MADEGDDPPRGPEGALSVLMELVDVSRSRRRRAERAGEAADTVEGYYLVELQFRLELARERERRSLPPEPP